MARDAVTAPAPVRRALPAGYRAAAPMRLDFAGAWTDVPPFSAREGGAVVNAAISLRAHAEIEFGGERLRLVSLDLGQEVECANSGGLVLDGRLDLLKAGLRMLPVTGPCTLTTRSDAPAGSGLGASGALDVALVACLNAARQDHPPPDARELAEQGWYLEAVEAGVPGGKQDQFAAALGGFHRLTFRDPDVGIEPLTLDAAFVAELERRTLLCYTGQTRVSGRTIARVMTAYEHGTAAVTQALRALRELADPMAEALRRADLARVGALLSENWRHQQALDVSMRTPEMALLERAVMDAGALGGKAAGAGAGGCMFFVLGRDRGPAEAAAREAGATVLPVSWCREGARAW